MMTKQYEKKIENLKNKLYHQVIENPMYIQENK